jgi:hypothetical protein
MLTSIIDLRKARSMGHGARQSYAFDTPAVDADSNEQRAQSTRPACLQAAA